MFVPSEEKDRYLSHSLVRGLEILQMFDVETPTLSLAEISSRLHVGRTVPYRLLYTLQAMGFISQDENTKRYELSPKVLNLGFSYLTTLQIPDISKPYLEQLRDRTGASAHLGVLDGKEIVYVLRVAARGITSLNVSIGSRLPAHATSIGKCLLAYQPNERLNELLYGSELQPFTNQTKTKVLELRTELTSILENGYAMSKGEFESGIHSIAAPIFDRSGTAVAAINIAAPKSFLNEEFISAVALNEVCKTALLISEYFGYRLTTVHS